LTALKIF